MWRKPAPSSPTSASAGSLVHEPPSVADTLGGDEDALGVHAVEDVAEPHALLADQAVGGNLQIGKEQLIGRMVNHRFDGAHFERAAGLAQIDQEDREAARLVRQLVVGRGARQ